MKAAVGILVALVVSGCVIQPLKSVQCNVDRTNGHILMSWENGEKRYEKVNIEVGEQERIEVDGRTTSYEYENNIYGLFEFELYGSIYELKSPSKSCSVDVGRLVWDADTSGKVTGYHIYVWGDNEEQPNKNDMIYSIGVTNNITLRELYDARALPLSRETTQLKVALSAHDNKGNISDLSNVVSFPWTTMLKE